MSRHYHDSDCIATALERIADALEEDNLTNALLQVADVFKRQLALAEVALSEHEGVHQTQPSERQQ
jgi:hypothetical protein